MTDFDSLWVPLLTHYDDSAERRLDHIRTSQHIASITPCVWQYLIAGTTGDGWEMSDAVLDDWIRFAQSSAALSPRHKLLFGAFGATTEEVIERAVRIERAIAAQPLRGTYAGLTLCAPVDPDASQDMIADHFARIIAATTSPLAIYQLPQVVQCEIAPETFAALAEATPRITLFKDTSGDDRVASASVETSSVRMLRGAEGAYASHMKPYGSYDGWLLSTANGLAPQLRAIASMVEEGDQNQAVPASAVLTTLVEALFGAATGLPSGNPFSNANRAVDHVGAHGSQYIEVPARLASGDMLPTDFLVRVRGLLSEAGIDVVTGYVDQ